MESNIMDPDQTAPLGSSLIRVHTVCNVDCLRTKAENRRLGGRWRIPWLAGEKGIIPYQTINWLRKEGKYLNSRDHIHPTLQGSHKTHNYKAEPTPIRVCSAVQADFLDALKDGKEFYICKLWNFACMLIFF